MFTDGEIWCQTINYTLLACYSWKQNWKIASATDFMAFLVKALFQWNECSKNADISILSNFLAIFFDFFFDIEKFYQYYLRTKFQINWTIANKNYRICSPPPPPPPPAMPICKKPGLFRVNRYFFREKEWNAPFVLKYNFPFSLTKSKNNCSISKTTYFLSIETSDSVDITAPLNAHWPPFLKIADYCLKFTRPRHDLSK